MTSNFIEEAYVWIWLPNETVPVVAGRLAVSGNRMVFTYGQSYLERIGDEKTSIAIYEPELPLVRGLQQPLSGLYLPGCIRDASPDNWGRRVIMNNRLSATQWDAQFKVARELEFFLGSGSDRIGALDFQKSPTEYEPRFTENASIEDLAIAADRIETGVTLNDELSETLIHRTSIGGARPKATIHSVDRKHIGKFSSRPDPYNMVKVECLAMRLAKLAGIDVPTVKLIDVAGNDVLLVERFDRQKTPKGWVRKVMVSALTMLKLDEMLARYASYADLAETIRFRFKHPKRDLRELFTRLAFNVLCGNTDDHARNHAAFWDGEALTLTPAYDICPQPRAGIEASQGMLIHEENNLSQLRTCLLACRNFLLSEEEAHIIFDRLIRVIQENWDSECDAIELSAVEKDSLWGRQFLNPFSLVRS